MQRKKKPGSSTMYEVKTGHFNGAVDLGKPKHLPKAKHLARRKENVSATGGSGSLAHVFAHRIGSVPLVALSEPNWKQQLAEFLKHFGHSRSNDFSKRCSEETKDDRRYILYQVIGEIMADKNLRSLSMVKPRHLPRMIELWDERGVSKRTQINSYNAIRYFWRVCGIEIPPIKTYEKVPGEFTIERNAQRDNSWSGNGVDFEEIHKRISEYDPVAGRIILAIKTYGLRRKEALCVQPHKADGLDRLLLTKGTKTGRNRELVFDEFGDSAFRKILDELKWQVTPEQHLAWSNRTLKQAKSRLDTICRKFGIQKKKLGVTLHGLRTEFAIEKFKELTGIDAPVRGGLIVDYRTKAIAIARLKVTEALGHTRPKITGAYYGSFLSRNNAQLRNFEQSWQRIEIAMRDVGYLLNSNGIENLYWIGDRANGNATAHSPYRFVLPPGLADEVALQLAPQIAEMVEAGTGFNTEVILWKLLSSAQQTIQESEAVPIFQAVSPIEYMRSRIAAERVARSSEGIQKLL